MNDAQTQVWHSASCRAWLLFFIDDVNPAVATSKEYGNTKLVPEIQIVEVVQRLINTTKAM